MESQQTIRNGWKMLAGAAIMLVVILVLDVFLDARFVSSLVLILFISGLIQLGTGYYRRSQGR